ncbi:MAG: hypothetical protein JO246_15340 [Frankiaceae bacterium]|nr:hypothetical protein [Frankiaceae bacterium]MBV9869345.1 hypothetical protein [Frankiaceae bacterium]
MSRTFKDSPQKYRGKRRDLSVRGVRKRPADLRKLSRAVVQIAMEEAAAEKAAQAEAERRQPDDGKAPDA